MSQYSIKDIARLSGFSVATVSRVLNNKGKYSEETKKKVLKVIHDTGYKIDSSAQSLRTNVTHTIGILVPDILNPFFADLVQKIEEGLFKQNYSTIICSTDKNENKEKAYLRMLENKKVDGIIVISGSYRHGFQFQSSLKEIPYICIDREPENFKDTIFISSNHRLGAKAATDYLLNHGSHFPVMVTQAISSSIKSRIEGFREALEEHHFHYDEQNNLFSYQNESSLKELFQRHPQIDAFFSASDKIAIALIMELKKMGKKIPEDVQVIGFDNIPFASVLSPALSTVDQNSEKIARTAVENMLLLLDDPKEKGNQVLIPTKLILRKSTK